MQAVLTVAGQSSRLYPFGGKEHKSTLRLLGKPLIVHTLEALIKNSITDIVVVDSPENGVRDVIAQANLSANITFVSHEGSRGMGECLLDARAYLQKEFLLIHPHHVDAIDIVPEFVAKISKDVSILVKREKDLSEYGAVSLDGDTVTKLVEKPKDFVKYQYRVVGCYYLNEQFLDTLSETKKNHYSFEDALSSFIDKNTVKAVEAKDNILSLKYPFHLFDIGEYLLSKAKESAPKNCTVHKTATLSGKVVMGENVTVMEHAVIKGPCYIGDNVTIGNNAILRENVIVESGSTIGANMEVKRSIFFPKSSTHSGFIGDSIVGSGSKIAARFTTGNVRLDRKNISVIIRDKTIDTGRKHLGVFIGKNVRIGIHVTTMPGCIIGNNSVIGPHTVVMQNVFDNRTYYSKFEGVVEKRKKSDEHVDVQSENVFLFDIDYTLFDTGKFKESDLTEFILYDEVIDVLQKLGRDGTLGIFSEGELDFQKSKLVHTMIHVHFSDDHIHIVTDKHATIGNILQKYVNKKLTLVDDKIEILELAKALSENIYTIWVKRGPFAENSQSQFSPDATVETLDQIIDVIEKREKRI